MSMSSLSAQLASLNASSTGGKNAGSSLSTSKRHEDAVGRGVAHSATHGHSLSSASPRHKPSVLYTDSRAASDVPLTTLRENCVSSLRQLARLSQNDTFLQTQFLQTLAGVHSLSYERGLATRAENDRIDQVIGDLLSLLSTTMAELACFNSSLHVLEYLLRRYDIHARPDTAHQFILATLPHHEQPLFLRVLQLVDLASLPTWAFLRPYAAKGSPAPSRTVLAKRASRDNALLVHCCELTKTAAKLHENECSRDNKGPSVVVLKSPRRGVSRVVSFAAAVIMEALSIQHKNQGSVSEPSLRCVLPFVLSACGSSSGTGNSSKSSSLQKKQCSLGVVCPDWRGFGHVLVACLTERCVLSSDAREALATTIIKGALDSNRAIEEISSKKSSGGEVGDESEGDVCSRSLELAADAILAAMTVLSHNSNEDDPANVDSYLPIIVSTQGHTAATAATEHVLGYHLPHSTFRALCRTPYLAQALGYLYADRDISVAPLMASILVLELKQLEKGQLKKKQKASSSLQLIVDLIREESLLSVWMDKNINLTASFAAASVISFSKIETEEDGTVPPAALGHFRSVLEALRTVNSKGCDAGIAHAVTTVCARKKGSASSSRSSRKKRISLLLGLATVTDNLGSGPKEKTGDEPPGDDLSSAHMLPPRVALEHHDVMVRLRAIQRVMEEASDSDVERIDEETLEHALLRHFSTEDDLNVVIAAGTALQTLLQTRKTNCADDSFADMALNALHKWCIFESNLVSISNGKQSKSNHKKTQKIKPDKAENDASTESLATVLSEDRLKAFDIALTIAAHAARPSMRDGHDILPEGTELGSTGFTSGLLVQGIAAHLLFKMGGTNQDDIVERIVASASNALHMALGKSPPQRRSGRDRFDSAKKLLSTNGKCSQILKKCCTSPQESSAEVNKTETSMKSALERRFLWVMLVSLTDSLETMSSNVEVASDALSTCLCTLKSKSNWVDRSEHETGVLLRCLGLCAKDVATKDPGSVPGIIISLASIPSSEAYTQVSAPAIREFCDCVVMQNQSTASPISVVMEASSRLGVSDEALERLLLEATSYLTSKDHGYAVGAIHGIVPVLMHLCHTDQRVRRAALELLCNIAEHMDGEEDLGDDEQCRVMKMLCELASPDLGSSGLHSSVLLDGPTALPKFLSKSIETPHYSTKLQECVLRLCFWTSCAYGGSPVFSKEEDMQSGWLPCGGASGGCRAASFILNALELTGETAYPLSLRWDWAGKDIFHMLLRIAETAEVESKQALQTLVDSIVRMLKGVIVVDATSLHNEMTNIVISTGPSRSGTRMRSYSVGKLDGVSFIEPYPEDMHDAILKSISIPFDESTAPRVLNDLCEAVVRNVLGSRSWGDGVFRKLPSTVRRGVLSRLLYLRSTANVDSAGFALANLPMDASDICFLLQNNEKEYDNLVALTFLADWTRTNSALLMKDHKLAELFSLLSDLLASLSSTSNPDTDEVGGSEFARLSILQALLSLSEGSGEVSGKAKPSRTKQRELISRASFLVRLIGGSGDSSVRPLVSGRARSVALAVLSNLCSQTPTAVVGSLIPAMLANMITGSDKNALASREAGGAFLALVPVYCRYADSANLSLLHLFTAFVVECQKLPDQRNRLKIYGDLVHAFVSIPRPEGSSPDGTLISVFLASEVYRSTVDLKEENNASTLIDSAEHVGFALDVLQFVPPADHVACLLQLLRHSNDFIVKLGGVGKDTHRQPHLGVTPAKSGVGGIDIKDIETVALNGPAQTGGREKGSAKAHTVKYDIGERHSIMNLTVGLLSVIRQDLTISAVRKQIKKSEGMQSALCLRLWQDLLLVQATAVDAQSMAIRGVNDTNDGVHVEALSPLAKSFWESSRSILSETLEDLQNLLPTHLFLASATSLIREGNADGELRGRAVRLVAERAAEAAPDSAEASLFLETVPLLTELLTKPSGSSENETSAILQQSALIAIEHLARTLCLSLAAQNELIGNESDVFYTALDQTTGILDEKAPGAQASSKGTAVDDASTQLLCSASLCASTLVRVLKARCLPLLPRLIGPLLKSLSATNVYLQDPDGIDKEAKSAAKVLQTSVLRALVAIADTLPQFLVPYLGPLLSPASLPSAALRSEDGDQDLAVKSLAEHLEGLLSTRTPARQLIPAIHGASSECQGKWAELYALLKILMVSVQSSARAELATLRNMVLKTLITAYEHKCSDQQRSMMFSSANEVLLASVLKLSEAQLRPLYASLREWRGELDGTSTDAVAASRRLAFWSLSAVLSKELRTIFLPCLSTVVSDAVAELEFAVSKLCAINSSEKRDGGKKKRRLTSSSSVGDLDLKDLEYLRALQPLLLCMESALKADAHEGGNWARADDGERFNSFLAPLGKLLQCRIPPSFPLAVSTKRSKDSWASPFQQVVQGVEAGEFGNVIGCITALASAAGNEQLWKPLNLAVLEACGNESRSEVRKAGVTCLLSLLKTLGEEYMVLLPECLPVLSELLEDGDEEIAALAQECVSLGEDLLGESLQDSLT